MPATKIGDKVIRVDAIEKARGEATYVCDMTLPDMQYAYMVRSMVPRGTIDAIHLPEMPEEWNQIAFDDHVYDVNTKGRKTPTHRRVDNEVSRFRKKKGRAGSDHEACVT